MSLKATKAGQPDRRDLANAIRALSMDAVQAANSGHPGAPMGMADIAEVLWNDYHRQSDDAGNEKTGCVYDRHARKYFTGFRIPEYLANPPNERADENRQDAHGEQRDIDVSERFQ